MAKKNLEISSLKKYGTKSPLASKIVRDKIYEKYGGDAKHIINSKGGKTRKVNSLKTIISKIEKLGYTYISNEDNLFKIKCNKCGHINEVTRSSINYNYRNNIHIYCNKCEYKESTFRSNFEKDVVNEIGKLIKDTKYSILTNKHIYNGKEHYEVDILIPELKLAIDCNGLYWHSELQKSDNYYHYKKKEFIENQGYSLIYIWEDDWNDINKRDIILSRLSSKMNLNKHIYARKCIIKKLSLDEYKNFCNENHLDGFISASIKIGLFYNNELVQCIGIRKHTGLYIPYEILRICSKKYINVIGGISKLIKYIINTFNIDKLYTYTDLSWIKLNGMSYINSGFILDKIINNEFWYVFNEKRFDNSFMLKNCDNSRIYMIYGPGKIKFIYKKLSL